MTSVQLAADLTDYAVLVALTGSLSFLAAVALLDPRLRKSGIGKALITLDIGLAGLEAPSVLHQFLGLQITQAWFAWYFFVTIVLVGTATWWRTVLMIAAQVRGRRKRAAEARAAAGPEAALPPDAALAVPVPLAEPGSP